MRFGTLSYRHKLLLWVLPIVAAGLLSLGAGAYWYIDDIIARELTQSMLATTGKAAEGINIWCKTLVLEPQTIAATPAAREINESFAKIDQQNRNRKQMLQQQHPDLFLDVYAANRAGVYHTVASPEAGDGIFVGDISNRPYFQDIMAGGPSQLTPPLLSRTTGVPTIFVVAPISDENGRPQGLVGAGISLGYVQQMAQSLQAGQSGYGIVVSQDGTFIYHPRKDLVMQKKITDFAEPTVQELGRRMLAGGSGVYRYVMDGEQKVAFYQPVPFAGWSVATTVAESELLAPLLQMLRFLALITLVIVLLVGAVLWSTARQLTRPLQQLALQAREISAGRFELPPLAVRSGDEVGRLAAAFNAMAGAMRRMLGELAAQNLELGAEVQERQQAQAALALSEEKFSKVFRYSGEIIGIVRVQDRRYLDVNDQFFEVFGYRREEVLGRSSSELGLWCQPEEYERFYEAIQRERSVKNREICWRGKDGSVRVGLASADIIEITGEDCIIYIWHDITEHRLAQEALQQAHDELEHKVEEKTQALFAANAELQAVNGELNGVNAVLGRTNRQLQEEVAVRRQTEERLVIRERQYRATTSLLTRPIDETEKCLAAILQNAIQLVKAPDGYIGLYDASGQTFFVHHALGLHAVRVREGMPGTAGMQGEVYASGEMLYVPDYRLYPGRLDDQRLARMSTVIMLPLKQGAQVRGILAASWVDEVHAVSEEDVEVLRQFGDLASVALERSHAQEQMHRLAFQDALTGLPNRASLQRRLRQELERSRRGEAAGAVLFIDIDDLKAVNDNFGHSSGDSVIVAASKSIREAVGPEAFVARLGGDEFVVLLPGVHQRPAAAAAVAQVVAALGHEYRVAGRWLHMSASIGVVLYPEDSEEMEDLLKKADSAMYAAKKAGRDCWRFYEPALSTELYERLALTNSLRRVLERQELFLQYQPLTALDGRGVVGFEALLRWESPEYGRVSPARFIPLAEQSGLILAIGQWALQQACRFARSLGQLGRGDVYVAVNISPRQLLADDFVDMVRRCLEEEGVAPEQITLEVTESVLIESMETSIEKLRQLRALGISLALDDFGIGYSSLTYLKRLPVTILKMDKSFIDIETAEETQEQLIGAIISLGHTLGMRLVAEGVETTSQLEMLRRQGCDCIQGYNFSRPVRAEAAARLLEQP